MAGERLVSETADHEDATAAAESLGSGHETDLLCYLLKARAAWRRNTETVDRLAGRREFGVLVGDEAYQGSMSFADHPERRRVPYVIMFDFMGVDGMSRSHLDHAVAYDFDRTQVRCDRAQVRCPPCLGGVPTWAFSPERSVTSRTGASAQGCLTAEGMGAGTAFLSGAFATSTPAVRRRPGKCARASRQRVKTPLSRGGGGTSIGKDLLDACGGAFPHIGERLPEVRTVLVCGSRLPALPQTARRRQHDRARRSCSNSGRMQHGRAVRTLRDLRPRSGAGKWWSRIPERPDCTPAPRDHTPPRARTPPRLPPRARRPPVPREVLPGGLGTRCFRDPPNVHAISSRHPCASVPPARSIGAV